jgi:competence ComEA-like helix-hairpin-helix protein
MFNITLQERQVLVFLLAVTALGAGVQVLVKHCAPVRSVLFVDPDFGKIDINSADQALLMEISGIGEKLARRIIDYRCEHGRFADPGELRNIKGLSGRRLEKVKTSVVAR